MSPGIETAALTADPSVDPIVLVVMFAAFLIGAVGPFALCVIGSIRDERAMRRYAAAAAESAAAAAVTTIDPAVVVPAALPLNASALDVDGMEPANDDTSPAPRLAVRS